MRLPNTKTGAKVVHLGDPAMRKPGSHLTDLLHPWRRIRMRAGLDDVRLHDLRHSFASGGLLVGEGLPMIGKLLGHTQVQTTARYAISPTIPSRPPQTASQAESPTSQGDGNHIEA